MRASIRTKEPPLSQYYVKCHSQGKGVALLSGQTPLPVRAPTFTGKYFRKIYYYEKHILITDEHAGWFALLMLKNVIFRRFSENRNVRISSRLSWP